MACTISITIVWIFILICKKPKINICIIHSMIGKRTCNYIIITPIFFKSIIVLVGYCINRVTEWINIVRMIEFMQIYTKSNSYSIMRRKVWYINYWMNIVKTTCIKRCMKSKFYIFLIIINVCLSIVLMCNALVVWTSTNSSK